MESSKEEEDDPRDKGITEKIYNDEKRRRIAKETPLVEVVSLEIFYFLAFPIPFWCLTSKAERKRLRWLVIRISYMF